MPATMSRHINMVPRPRRGRSRSGVNASKETIEPCFWVWIVNFCYHSPTRQSDFLLCFLELHMSAAHQRAISSTGYFQGVSENLLNTISLMKPSIAMPFSNLPSIMSINQHFTANRPWKRRAERNATRPCACLVCDHNRYFIFS